MSLNNVISFLRIVNGVPPNKCQFNNPTSKDAFEKPWKQSVGVNHINFDLIIEEKHINPFSKEDILKSYDKS